MPKPYGSRRRTWDPLLAGTLSSGLILDLCPSYTATVTLGAGSNVAAIADRSTSANNFVQATGAAQPTLNTTDANYANRASITFAGAQQIATTGNMVNFGSTTGSTICMVQRFSSTAGVQMLVDTAAVYTPTSGISLLLNGNVTHQLFRAGGVLQYGYTVTPTNTTTTFRRTITSDIGASAATGAHYLSGVLANSATGAAGVGSTFTTDKWYVGSAAGLYYYSGTIGRVLAWNRVLTGAEITALDAGLVSFFS